MAESAISNTSLSAGSETVFDIVCQPCSFEGKNAEAEGYCQDCCEHLCTQCIGHHRKFSISRHHNILDKESMPKTEDTPQVTDVCTERCQIHKDKILEYFCPAHKILGCSACITLNHKLCEDVDYIPEVAVGFEDSANYKEFNTRLENLIQKSKDVVKIAQESKKRSSDGHFKVIQEIEACRQGITDAVDRQANEIKDCARQINAQDTENMDSLVYQGNKVLVELQSMSSDFSTLLNKKRFCQMFIEIKNKEQKITKLQRELDDMDGVEITDYKFQADEDLHTMVKGECGIGKLMPKGSENTGSSSTVKRKTHKHDMNVTSRNTHQMKPTHVADINVKSASNSKKCCISGVALFVTNQLVITDNTNGTIKLIDTTKNIIMSELKPDRFPFDVTVSGDKIAVTLPSARKILFLKCNIYNGLVHDRDVSVNGSCRGIACSDDKLFVIFDIEKKLEIMTMTGIVLQRFDTNDQGIQLFKDPTYVAVSSNRHSIYVSEWGIGQVNILGMDGKQKGLYENADLGEPRQLAIDEAGMIFLCDLNDRIHLLSPQCTKIKILLTKQDGVIAPWSVCYEKTGRLYVGMRRSNTIKVYQVS